MTLRFWQNREELIKDLKEYANAQDTLASQTTEDREYWHHVGLATMLRCAAWELEKEK